MNYHALRIGALFFIDHPELWFLQRLFAYHRSSRIKLCTLCHYHAKTQLLDIAYDI